jgi:hypothetical protein
MTDLTLVTNTVPPKPAQPEPPQPQQTDGRLFLEGKASRPTAKRVRKLFAYDRETGVLRWRVNRGSARAGEIAGHLRQDGYIGIGIDGEDYLAHCIIWLGVHGEWPTSEIDHRDTCRSNNSWENLREATRAEQNSNRGIRSDNATGVKGITRLPSGLYSAAITKDGRGKIALGTFATLAEAADAWWAASREVHGEYARQDRRLTDEHHYDRIEQYRGRPTLAQLRERARTWRDVQEMVDWLDWLDAEMVMIDQWRAVTHLSSC